MKQISSINEQQPVVSEITISLKERLMAVFQGDALLNGLMVSAITVGFFHGWLKTVYPHPATTFLFDALLSAALFMVIVRMPGHLTFIPRGPVGTALKAFYVVCALYVISPFGPSLLVGAAAFRGWCFASLMFCLGYHMTKNAKQVRGYFYVLILLAVVTSAIGMRQKPEDIERRMKEDTHFAERHKFTYYEKEGSARQFRAFSTFVSAGTFGAVMAYVLVVTFVLASDPNTSRRQQIMLCAAALPMAYGVVLSGSRSPLIMIAVGFGVCALVRRKLLWYAVLPLVLYVAIQFGDQVTEGAVVKRYETLLEAGTLANRATLPLWIGWNYMQDNLLGGGLGKSGYSLPFFIYNRADKSQFIQADGDLGCLLIEMGLIGIIVFGRVIWSVLRMHFNTLRELKGSPVETIALGSSAIFIMALIALPVGSPFLGIPMGALAWFFNGTLLKLAQLHREGAFAAEVVKPAPLSPHSEGKRFLYYKPGA